MVRLARLVSLEDVTCLLFYPGSVSESGNQSFFFKDGIVDRVASACLLPALLRDAMVRYARHLVWSPA